MTSIFDNTFWIIRSAGERTTQACYDLVNAFIPRERIRIIRGTAIFQGYPAHV